MMIDDNTTKKLIESIKDPDDNVSILSARILHKVGGRKDLAKLFLDAIPGKTLMVKKEFLRLIASMESTEYIPDLLDMFKREEPSVQPFILRTIVKLDSKENLEFLFDHTKSENIEIKKEAIIPIVYILVSGIFEMTFIYGFLRKIFDKSFGIIPGILLTAVFYSFHHAGFQPEFGKLIFVGIMYAGIYRITNNLLIVFPFFWGIGAIWDVLVNF